MAAAAAALFTLGRSYRRFDWKMGEDERHTARTADGFSVDFGHDDLLAGLAAPAEVFPRLAGWLAARSVA